MIRLKTNSNSRKQSKSPMSLIKAVGDYVKVCREHNLFVTRRPRVQIKQLLPSASAVRRDVQASKKEAHGHEDPELWRLVSKGSQFQQNIVRESLKPLGFPVLRRSQERRQRDHTLDHVQYTDGESTGKGEFERGIIHTLDGQAVAQIISTLVEITPRGNTPDDVSPLSTRDAHLIFKAPKHVYTEIPPIPNFSEYPEQFEDYIYRITHSTFHHKQSSKFNGIIPKMLRNMFHPLNSNTLNIRTADSFNYVIHYFVKKWDIATCRELIVQMKAEHKTPTTTTYNIMLNALTTLQNIIHKSDPYKIALKHLTQMKRYNLKADVVTWNIVFNILRDDPSKEILVQKRKELKVPIDDYFTYSLMKHFSKRDGITGKKLLEVMRELGFALDGRLVTLVVKMLISERQFTNALKIVSFAHENESMNYRANRKSLNKFLDEFAKLKRVDLCIGAMNTFERSFGVTADYDTYTLLFEAMARSGYWKDKYALCKVLYHRMLNDLGVVAGDYWLKKLRSRLKFIHDYDVNLSYPLTEKERNLEKIITEFAFTEWKVPRWMDNNRTVKDRIASKRMGYYASRDSVGKNQSLEMKNRRELSRNYKSKIDAISITKAMQKRIPYAKDPFKELKEELSERGIISS